MLLSFIADTLSQEGSTKKPQNSMTNAIIEEMRTSSFISECPPTPNTKDNALEASFLSDAFLRERTEGTCSSMSCEYDKFTSIYPRGMSIQD